MTVSEQPHRTAKMPRANTAKIRLLSFREQNCSTAQPKGSSWHTTLYIGELSAAFLLGHLCRALRPLGLVLVLQLHGAVAPAEPRLSQKTPPRAQQHCCCFITRASTACTAPQHSSHGWCALKAAPRARTPAAAPTPLTLAQGRALCQHGPSRVTRWPQGIPPVCCWQTTGPGQSRGTAGTAGLCWAALPWQPGTGKGSARAGGAASGRQSSHTADKACGENGIRDSKKSQKLLQILH